MKIPQIGLTGVKFTFYEVTKKKKKSKIILKVCSYTFLFGKCETETLESISDKSFPLVHL